MYIYIYIYTHYIYIYIHRLRLPFEIYAGSVLARATQPAVSIAGYGISAWDIRETRKGARGPRCHVLGSGFHCIDSSPAVGDL